VRISEAEEELAKLTVIRKYSLFHLLGPFWNNWSYVSWHSF